VPPSPFIRLDDPDYVIENDHVNSGLSFANIVWATTAMYASNWHPLTWISHMIDVEFFGLDAGRHILINVLLHAANSILLFIFLRRATRCALAERRGGRVVRRASAARRVSRVGVGTQRCFEHAVFPDHASLVDAVVQTQMRSRYWWSVAAFAAA